MAERQNLTVTLDGDTIRSAKILAASRGTSVSRLLADLVVELVDRERSYEQAKKGALAHLKRGFALGGEISSTRDELHAR
ncbi:MAG: DUF6364 family protein [Proteobacteria bacterium]|jgi:hypothetical protein|nr:DUF6364 family protein [Pseudomonadota bacterium]